MGKNSLIQVFIAIFFGVLAGYWTPEGSATAHFYHLLGQAFLNALKCVVIPLVVTSVISSVAQMSAEGTLRTLGKKIFYYFFITGALAVFVGYGSVMLFNPGGGQEVSIVQEMGEAPGFDELLLKVIPPNIIMAAAEGNILGLILFSLVFGYFTPQIDSDYAKSLLNVVRAIYQLMLLMTRLIMVALPVGVFGLVAEVISATGMDALKSATWFLVTVLFGLGVYTCVVIPLLLLSRGISPIAHFRAILPALFTAFSTSSSAAALPLAITGMAKRSSRISHLTLPLGSSLNVPGTALYLCVSVFFLTQIYGIEMSFGMQALVVSLSLFASFGIAGVPSASIVALLLILNTLGLPTEQVGLLLAGERLVDMFRSVVNVVGNTCSTACMTTERPSDVLTKAT